VLGRVGPTSAFPCVSFNVTNSCATPRPIAASSLPPWKQVKSGMKQKQKHGLGSPAAALGPQRKKAPALPAHAFQLRTSLSRETLAEQTQRKQPAAHQR